VDALHVVSLKKTMKRTSKPLALQEWRYPRTYRTIFAREPKSIYQADVMYLIPLWRNIFNDQEIQTLGLKKYALVCIDIYSRYVWAVAMDKQDAPSTANAMIKIFVHMGKPKILQGDQKIIDYFKKEFSEFFSDITLITSKRSETNKMLLWRELLKQLKTIFLNIYIHMGFQKNLQFMTSPPQFFNMFVL
jgi:transposase InsO family protein